MTHPIIQKEVDEVLARGAADPSVGGTGFYPSVFVVPICTGGLEPMLKFKQFNCFMHIPTLKMPTIRQVWELIQDGNYPFSVYPNVAYLHIPIVKHHHPFLWYVLAPQILSAEGFTFLLSIP